MDRTNMELQSAKAISLAQSAISLPCVQVLALGNEFPSDQTLSLLNDNDSTTVFLLTGIDSAAR